MTLHDITVKVNDTVTSAAVEPRTLLCDYIRHSAGLTGTHVGCEQGACGACTVLVDGQPVRSCLMFAVQAEGCSVETVESLATDGQLSGLQQAIMDNHGLQCGFCTPGLLMSLTAAERSGASLEYATTDVLNGHLCRCTGYVGIRAAIERHWRGNHD
jgi:aerobic-type carbon monoxide dehydrogenase small subunit (CoxS/CutS family)